MDILPAGRAFDFCELQNYQFLSREAPFCPCCLFCPCKPCCLVLSLQAEKASRLRSCRKALTKRPPAALKMSQLVKPLAIQQLFLHGGAKHLTKLQRPSQNKLNRTRVARKKRTAGTTFCVALKTLQRVIESTLSLVCCRNLARWLGRNTWHSLGQQYDVARGLAIQPNRCVLQGLA